MTKGGNLQKEYWFKAKKYGWGWGLPTNLKGWISFGLFLGIWLGALQWMVSSGGATEQIPTRNILIFAAIFLADLAWFAAVSFKYGEPPKWRWGSKHDAAKSRSD